MADAAHATPGPVPPPPPRRHGCLYGCLIAVGIFLVAGIGGAFYLYHYMNTALKDAPTVKAAIVQLNSNQEARAVLGDNIEMTGASSFNASTDMATGSKESYTVHVKGTKGEGEYMIEADTPRGGHLHFDKLTLQANGQNIDILNAEENPGAI